MANKIESNVTGLSFAEEETLKQLPVSPVFFALEPNSYNDFGGEITTIARNPINPSRQRKKGVTSDLDASGGFNQDWTFTNSTRILQGFMFADMREKGSTDSVIGYDPIQITGVVASTDTYSAAGGMGVFEAGQLVMASGFSLNANNGLKNVVSATGTTCVVSQALADETPTIKARLDVVGYEFDAGDVNANSNGLATSAFDFTDLPLVAGEWVYLGSDTPSKRFANNMGWARISLVTPTQIFFDKTSWDMVSEAGTGKSIQLYFGNVLKNEKDPTLIKRRTYHIERTLGFDDDGQMSEYLIGACANEISINVSQADKVTIDMSFVAVDNDQRTGADGLISGARVESVDSDAFNTSDDFARIKLSSVTGNSNPLPLFAFATEMTLTINNNVKPSKAIAVLGAFDTSAGTFEVGGSMSVYFANIEAVRAVRQNADITLDLIMMKENRGIVVDFPLLSLGNGRLGVEQDADITLPLDLSAAESQYGHTMLMQFFPYLPTIAGN